MCWYWLLLPGNYLHQAYVAAGHKPKATISDVKAFTGTDSRNPFRGKGKKTAFK